MYKFLFFLYFLPYLIIPVSAQDFITGFEDIPLMNGLYQTKDSSFSFGNEETRLVETTLSADKKISFSEVKSFYAKTLPQLGWALEKDMSQSLIFYRDDDILEISKAAQNPLKINITLKNRN